MIAMVSLSVRTKRGRWSTGLFSLPPYDDKNEALHFARVWYELAKKEGAYEYRGLRNC